MDFIIFDLEFNQQHPDDKTDDKPNLLFEVLQIGAIKLNENFKTISTFNALIKPNVYPKLHPYVEDLTKINLTDLNNSSNFESVYKDFIKFIGSNKNILVVWGTSDIKELLKNIKFNNLPISPIPKKYIDIQQYATKLFKLPKGQKIGLKKAVECLNISIEGDFHDAFFDSHYTCEVFKAIYSKKIHAKTYNEPLEKRPKVIKEKLDSEALIKEFEKIYNRKMSEEEIKIIRLAYFMGKTKQFIIRDE